jgi:hypothetical protein
MQLRIHYFSQAFWWSFRWITILLLLFFKEKSVGHRMITFTVIDKKNTNLSYFADSV